MSAIPTYAIAVQPFFQYDGTNGADVVQAFEDINPGVTNSVTDTGTHLRFYVGGAAGVLVDMDVDDWVNYGVSVVTDADFQTNYIQKS